MDSSKERIQVVIKCNPFWVLRLNFYFTIHLNFSIFTEHIFFWYRIQSYLKIWKFSSLTFTILFHNFHHKNKCQIEFTYYNRSVMSLAANLSESVINIKHIFIVNTSNSLSPFPDLQFNIPTKLQAASHPLLLTLK